LASSVAAVFSIFAGANFILYGPIENAKYVYFYCGLADAYVAYSAMQEFRTSAATREHPLFKIFK
ncbi:MAG: tetrahydromethanopterin S-methyltransferase subunit H, partial [Candidatus Bathyarchaeia archaeon]